MIPEIDRKTARLLFFYMDIMILEIDRKSATMLLVAASTMGIVILELDRTDRAGNGVSLPAPLTRHRANLQGRTNRARYVQNIAKSSLVADMQNLVGTGGSFLTPLIQCILS